MRVGTLLVATIYTSKMIYHQGATLSEHALLIEYFVTVYKPWITAGFVTVTVFLSMVSKNFVEPFLQSRKLLRYTHAWAKIHKLSLPLLMSLFMCVI